jgi:hypothetical protein
LVEVFETARLPRAIERFINQSSRSRRPTHQWLAMFADNRRLFALLPNPLSLISSGAAIFELLDALGFYKNLLQDTFRQVVTYSPRLYHRGCCSENEGRSFSSLAELLRERTLKISVS